jgi:uncharacterized RDD family membrane protein YckC
VGKLNPTDVVGRRVAAFVADVFILATLSSTLLWFFDNDWYQAPEGEVALSPTDAVAFYVLSTLIWVVYVLILEGLYGFTLGKLALQLRVVKVTGEPPGPLRALVRHLAWIVDSAPYCAPLLGFGLVVATNSHRRVGDLVAGTYVVDAPYFGRVIRHTPDGIRVGPKTVRPEDVGLSRTEFQQAVGLRPKEPVYDRTLDTYVVWNTKQDRLMAFDKKSNTWVPVQPQQPQP